tara:strand:+ start:261 stop:449 length:189 start_codon:yes stop_codon:yes gene_type:complete
MGIEVDPFTGPKNKRPRNKSRGPLAGATRLGPKASVKGKCKRVVKKPAKRKSVRRISRRRRR